jgi:methylthioribulose-1-phosphate dehydratase
VRFIGGDDGHAREAEVRHGARHRADVERIARRDQNNIDAFALRLGQQRTIVELRSWIATLLSRMTEGMQSELQEIEQLCATARECYARGWVPATSGNFSVRWGSRIAITPTGLDKGMLVPQDLLEIDMNGSVLGGRGRPSAETELHLVIYRERPDARSILHVHSVWNTLFSSRFDPRGYLSIEGYELLKALSGVSSHEHIEKIPIIENSQNYDILAIDFDEVLKTYSNAHGILLSRHGLYTWGESVAEARRHLEALEFLFEVEGRRILGRP